MSDVVLPPTASVPSPGGGNAGRMRTVLLWVLAVVVMLGSAVFQRLTGPTYPLGGSFEVGDREFRYELPRADRTTRDARVAIPNPGSGVTAALYFKRYRTDDALTSVSLHPEGSELAGTLPRQPPAGKLEYVIVVQTPDGQVRIPAQNTVVIRFRGPVSVWVLLPHIVFIFFALLFGVRAGLSALLEPAAMNRQAWTSIVLMTIGGLIFGPIMQKAAFGAYWTGFPFGYDLTDNKTVLMWLAWAIACGLLLRGERVSIKVRRGVVVAAAVVMMVVYLVPHSLRGSELDYSTLEQSAPAGEAPTGQE